MKEICNIPSSIVLPVLRITRNVRKTLRMGQSYNFVVPKYLKGVTRNVRKILRMGQSYNFVANYPNTLKGVYGM